MNRKVKFVRLQSHVFHIPGLGELGTTLPPTNKVLENLDMTLTDSGLVVSLSYQGIKKEIFVPSANLILADLAPAENA